MTAPRLIRAAGCIVWRYGSREPEVLLVHRPRLEDWSFPKGKLDRGEHSLAAAVREVEEETGLRVKLGPRLPDQHYVVNGRTPKVVAYWSAQPPVNADITSYVPNHEIDDLRWFRISRARQMLTYEHDGDLLDTFSVSGFDSSPLLIVRHAEARSRRAWAHDDSDRPLRAEGKRQALALMSVLHAYGIKHVISSDAARCVDTVLPYVNAGPIRLGLDPAISEDGARPKKLRKLAKDLLRSERRTALCTHRPVLPDIFEALGVTPVALEPAGILVIHRHEGKVVAVEPLATAGKGE